MDETTYFQITRNWQNIFYAVLSNLRSCIKRFITQTQRPTAALRYNACRQPYFQCIMQRTIDIIVFVVYTSSMFSFWSDYILAYGRLTISPMAYTIFLMKFFSTNPCIIYPYVLIYVIFGKCTICSKCTPLIMIKIYQNNLWKKNNWFVL